MEFRLRALRKEKNVSQLKLAFDLNMNQNTISRYENLERQADYQTLIAFADYFDHARNILRIRWNRSVFIVVSGCHDLDQYILRSSYISASHFS